MTTLCPTPRHRLLDDHGRPYFLWDTDLTLEAFQGLVNDSDPDVRAYFIGKLMRQAKPDDVFGFVSLRSIRQQWPRIERHLGQAREFWGWLLAAWERLDDGRR
jgi:hypothetical protein